jgi:hypothetical protein
LDFFDGAVDWRAAPALLRHLSASGGVIGITEGASTLETTPVGRRAEASG